MVNKAAKILAFAIQKGGSGKTTSVINVGAELAEKGFKVLLVDADPQYNLTTGLALGNPTTSLYDALMRKIDTLPIIEYSPLIHVVPSNIDLSAAEMELVSAFMRETHLQKLLEKVRDQYDFILIDCPPTLGILTINALAAADAVFIPVETEFYAMSGLDKLLDIRQMVQERVNPRLQLGGVILTKHDSRKVLHREVVKDVREFMPKGSVLETIIRLNVSLGEAPARGLTIFQHAPESFGAQDYKAATAEILSRM
jgi:chromosome partitioning protein